MRTMKFPAEYQTKVDLKSVNWEAIKGWVAKRATELLGVEDEVLVAYIFEQIEGKAVSAGCSAAWQLPCRVQAALTQLVRSTSSRACSRSTSPASWRRTPACLSRHASLSPSAAADLPCCSSHAQLQELWVLLASAAENPSGVPQRLLDEKAEELRKKKETQDRINVSRPLLQRLCRSLAGVQAEQHQLRRPDSRHSACLALLGRLQPCRSASICCLQWTAA